MVTIQLKVVEFKKDSEVLQNLKIINSDECTKLIKTDEFFVFKDLFNPVKIEFYTDTHLAGYCNLYLLPLLTSHNFIVILYQDLETNEFSENSQKSDNFVKLEFLTAENKVCLMNERETLNFNQKNENNGNHLGLAAKELLDYENLSIKDLSYIKSIISGLNAKLKAEEAKNLSKE